jgi:hypothetical protein
MQARLLPVGYHIPVTAATESDVALSSRRAPNVYGHTHTCTHIYARAHAHIYARGRAHAHTHTNILYILRDVRVHACIFANEYP